MPRKSHTDEQIMRAAESKESQVSELLAENIVFNSPILGRCRGYRTLVIFIRDAL